MVNLSELPIPRKLITLDLETYDPNLKSKGPGSFRNDGFVLGVAIKIDDNPGFYLPILKANPKIISYLKDLLSTNIPKLGANILYDLSWLHWLGIKVNGLKYDVQVAEALIDENQFKYNLESLASKYLQEHKLFDELLIHAQRINPKIKSRSEVYKVLPQLPTEIVSQYAIQDVELPSRIFHIQKQIIDDQGLNQVFMLETELTDCLLDMRVRGVRVDIDKAEQVKVKLKHDELILQKELNDLAGYDIQIWAAENIAPAFNNQNIDYPRTPKTKKPSFTAPWLETHPSRLAQLIVQVRKLNKMRTDFIENMILGSAVNGRIHSQFHQTRHDDGGTVSGRFSSSNPNLQQVPARDPVYAPLVRGLFIPEEGERWCKTDYSQQEPRVTVHYASLRSFLGAEKAVQKYNDDPDTDYHQMVADLCNIERRPAKDINLGLAYGMGVAKMATRLGKSLQETRELYKIYHDSVPYVKLLADECMRIAKTRGYIKTILGRRCRFDMWGPAQYDPDKPPLRYEAAEICYGLPLTRMFIHKALNRLIQGSSADMIKKAMRDAYQAGHKILLTVHDELGESITKDKQAHELKDIMLNAIKLLVPLKVDMFIENSWGECK